MFSALVISTCCTAATINTQERLPIEVIPVKVVNSIDYGTVFSQDEDREKVGLPLLFAQPTVTSITPATHGIWERLPDNKMRWTYRVYCDNAQSMNLGFGRYNMPQSGSMIILNETFDFQIRPFTSEDNKDHGELWTPIVPSNQAVIEIIVDRIDKRFVSQNIELTSINAGYRGFKGGEGRGSSGACNIDVLCSTGDDWWDEIPSVGVYTLNGYATCSGAMINNTAEDQTPYFLTANHCGVTNSSDATIVVYWNYQNSYCRTPGSGDSGGNGNGSFSQFTSGSTMRATRSYTDFTLTELSSAPNPGWGVTWSGWSRSSSTGGVGAGIHHPSTAEKRISIPDYSSASGEYWNVNWSQGTTEPGSSGSPLYDANHRIVGQLCCGAAACGNDANDYYGRSIGLSWSGSSSSSLSAWLDPLGTNPTGIDSLNPGIAQTGACCVGSSGSCVNIYESNCIAGGGTFLGEGTSCDDGGCEPDPTCDSDINGDGITDVSDILALVGAWGSSDADADVNGDGVVGVADLLMLIDAWGPC
jgi:V8-like Glu-specific endopeptidase